ncbi:MAG: transposase [Chloroflexi bacterium]|nr:transposase [Chloroflexota bacterium]
MNSSKMRGKKGQKCISPHRPPRRRANKRRGRGTYANDRPPVLGTIERSSGQVRLQVVHTTQSKTLVRHVHRFTLPNCHVFTDEFGAYQGIQRLHSTVTHSVKEWARDDNDDDVFEVHTNTVEGMWTGLRNFLRPFRGVSKRFLSGYVAIYEFRINLKRVSPAFISRLVAVHSFLT